MSEALAKIIMVELDGYKFATGSVETLRFCDGKAYRLRHTETPADALYRPFLHDPGWSRVDIYTAPGEYGHVTPGEIVLNDATGELGRLLTGYAFDGRKCVVRIGKRGAAYPSGYVTLLNGTIYGQPSFDINAITFRPADLGEAMRKPLLTTRFAGTNALPLGTEGVDDLKGKVKPIVFGLAPNMTPELVNTSKQIYFVSLPSGAKTVAVSAVRSKGVPLANGGTYADMAALINDANAPAGGAYKVLANTTDGTYFRLGSSPAGQVTCDAAWGDTATDRTHAQVFKRILEYMGVTAGSYNAADITALDAALSAEIVCAYFGEIDADQALTEVADSARCAWYGDSLGVYRLTQWTAPSGTPVETLTSLRTETIDIADVVGNGDVAPHYQVTLQYGKNFTVQADADLGGDKTSPTDPVAAPSGRTGLAARNWLAEEYRTVQATDSAVKTKYPTSPVLTLTSLIADATAAQAFCDAELALWKVARHMTTITQWLNDTQLNTIRVGTVVTVKDERWNYESGRLMRVAGLMPDHGTGKTDISVWG